MDEEILKKIEILEKKLDETHHSVETMKKYFFWTFIITVIVIVLPILGLLFLIPKFISIYTNALNF